MRKPTFLSSMVRWAPWSGAYNSELKLPFHIQSDPLDQADPYSAGKPQLLSSQWSCLCYIQKILPRKLDFACVHVDPIILSDCFEFSLLRDVNFIFNNWKTFFFLMHLVLVSFSKIKMLVLFELTLIVMPVVWKLIYNQCTGHDDEQYIRQRCKDDIWSWPLTIPLHPN